MSAMRADFDAAAAIVKRDWLLFKSYRLRFFAQVASVCFSVTIFHFIAKLVRVSAFATPQDYFSFALIGLITLQILNSTLHTPPGSLTGELVAGTFERFVVSPFGAVRAMLTMTIFPLLYALVSGLLMLTFGALLFGMRLHWPTLPLLVDR